MDKIEIFGNLASRILSDATGSERTLPPFFPRKYVFVLKLLDLDQDGAISITRPTVRNVSASIGMIQVPPRSGKFKLRFGSGTPTGDIPLEATADEFKTALMALTEATTYGLEEVYAPGRGCWMARFSEPIATPLQVADNLLEPESFVRIRDLIQGGVAWQEITLLQGPLASTSIFDRVLADAPTVTRIRAGATVTEGIETILINEIQTVIVPAGFQGTFALKFLGQQTRMFSVTDDPDAISEGLNDLYGVPPGARFIVTNPILHNAYVEFTGPFAGASQPLMEVVIGNPGVGELTYALNLDTSEMAAALRELSEIETWFEQQIEVVDALEDDGLMPSRNVIVFQAKIKVRRDLQWDGLTNAAPILWLVPPNPKDYNPHDPNQVVTGSQHYTVAIGDGVEDTFDIVHMLDSDSLIVSVRENVNGGARLTDDGYTVNFDNENHLTLTFPTAPAVGEFLVTISAAGPKSAFLDHTHPISAVTDLGDELDSMNSRVAQLEALLPTQLAASPNQVINPFGAEGSSSIISIDLNTKADLLPLSRAPQGLAMDSLTPTTANLPRASVLLPALHVTNTVIGDFTANETTNVFALTAHGQSNGTKVRVASTAALPAGLLSLTDYYLRDVTTDTFKLAATVGGAAIDITDAGTGTLSLSKGDLILTGLPSPLPSLVDAAGRVFAVTAPGLAAGGSGIRGEAVVAGDHAGCDGRIFYKVSKSDTPSGNSFYPTAFDRELFHVGINDAMLKVAATLTLRFEVWTQLFKATANAQYLLAVEFGTTPDQSTPAPVGRNLGDVVWSTTPVLQQRLILSDTGVKHSFGIQVIRDINNVLHTNKKIYGTVLAGDAVPAASNFLMRARLIEFDTENSVANATGLVYFKFSNAKIEITAGAVVAL